MQTHRCAGRTAVNDGRGHFRIGALPAAAALLTILLSTTSHAAALVQGPSSGATPYLVPSHGNLTIYSLLTVGDSVNLKPDGVTPYRMVGIPDGLGAYDNGNGTFTVLMNHELGAGAGVTRAHGSAGAFVAQWTVDKNTLQVLNGQDLVNTFHTYDATTGTYVAGTTAFNRLCSADLPALSAFYNAATGNGYNAGLIYMNGEEAGAEGRAFAHIATGAEAGNSYELPYLGKFSWENSVANAGTGDKTVVVGTDDSTPGQIYVYIGDKQATGNAVEKAGLSGGNLYGVAVTGVASEDRTTGLGGATTFSLANLGDVSAKSGATLQADSAAAGVTEFLRPEDGAWDPNDPARFYFVTTDRFDTVKTGTGSTVGRSRLWQMTFSDVNDFAAGGTIDMLLDGTGPYQMFDNMTVGDDGYILLQEDPGGNNYSARVWRYNIATGALEELAQHDPARFGDLGLAATAPFNNNEEASGIIDVSAFFNNPNYRYYLADVQAHYGLGGELVEGGQLLLLQLAVPEPAALGLLLPGLAFLGQMRRRRRG